MLLASVPRPWRVRGGDSPSACVPPALCSYLCNGKAGAVSANLIVAICPRLQSQPTYICRRHFAPLSGGKARVRFLYFACARAAQVGGMCRLGGGGLAGRKCARRAARGAPGVLCARSTSWMVVGKAPVAARGALRALKPRAAPWRRVEGRRGPMVDIVSWLQLNSQVRSQGQKAVERVGRPLFSPCNATSILLAVYGSEA